MPKRRVALGRRLPPVTSFPPPTEQQLDIISAQWDRLVPKWAGLLDAKAQGVEPDAPFYRDEIAGQVIRASDGHIVTLAEKRAAMETYLDGVRK